MKRFYQKTRTYSINFDDNNNNDDDDVYSNCFTYYV